MTPDLSYDKEGERKKKGEDTKWDGKITHIYTYIQCYYKWYDRGTVLLSGKTFSILYYDSGTIEVLYLFMVKYFLYYTITVVR